jgi:uncharacterized protein involved in exopolysaccharide biosynthesis
MVAKTMNLMQGPDGTPEDALASDTELEQHMAVLWQGKWTIFACAVVCAAIAGAASFAVRKQYEASVVLSPVSQSASTGGLGTLGSVASQMGGLAALAGIATPGDSAKAEAETVLQSENLTEAYIRKNDLLPILYKSRWDATKRAWKTTDPTRTPTLWKANRYFGESIRRVTTNAKSGIVTLTITWTDPQLAATWANGMVQMTNEFLRNKAIQELQSHIDYLNAEAAKATMVETRQAVFSLLETEINRSMIARGTEEYAFKVLDPATVAETPSSPKKVLWLLGGLAAGAFLSICWIFVRPRFGEIRQGN